MVDEMISRRAAIDLFPNDALEWDTKGGYIAPHLARRMIEELPSVQPDHVADISKKVKVEDCIGRQMVIDALDIAIERYDEMAEEYRKKADIERNDYMDMRDDAYEARQLAQWLNELKYLREKIEQITIKTEPKWIPVSERMPELDEDGYSEKVLVCFDRVSFCEICEYRTDKWYIGDMEDSPEDIGLRVTAWMPLPEPYQEGGE